MAVLISGIGRSGTTTVYEIVGKGLLNKYEDTRCVYEPYLWNIPEVERVAEVKGQPFSTNQVGLFNVNVHCNTPLFLEDRNYLHDHWLMNVFGPVSANSKKAPDNVMAKVIRGAGRLESALTRYDNLKVIIVTRNVVDTINSGLGLFSFFGDEFHPSDKKRFIDEINEKYSAGIDCSELHSEIDWSVLWWHYFTEASIRTYMKFPDRVKLVPYETYVKDKRTSMEEIFDFIGVERTHIDDSLFDRGAGPTTSISYLTMEDIEKLRNEVDWYFQRLEDATGHSVDSRLYTEKMIYKYSQRRFSESLLLSHPTDLTAVQWRIRKGQEMLAKTEQSHCNDALSRFSVTAACAQFGGNRSDIDRSDQYFARGCKVGVVVTCYNNEETIANSVYSVLAQTRPPDIICVSDDCSTDQSSEVIKSLSDRFESVHMVLRESNVGVAANRDLAIRSLDVDFVSTLDGDDLYFPEKIEMELLALRGSIHHVSFSDIVVVGKRESFLQDTTPYSGQDRYSMLKLLTARSSPVPRDMLFSKKLYIESGGFDVGMGLYEDWALKMRFMTTAVEKGWLHSGVKGTIYDRRSPGLSDAKSIDHAYAQLLALSRNADHLNPYPNTVVNGLVTVSKHLEGNMRDRMDLFVRDITVHHRFDYIFEKLTQFWNAGTFRDDPVYKFQHIWRFSDIDTETA